MNAYYPLRRTGALNPDRIAIHQDAGGVTYGEFHRRVLRVANMLLECGIRKGDRVAVLMLNSPRYLELYFATARIGAAVVPVNIRLSADETAFWLSDSETRILIVDNRFAGVPAENRAKIPSVERVLNIESEEYERLVAAAVDTEPAVPEPSDEDLAGLFYTSGTTGGPKGVMLTHRNLYANAVHMLLAGEFSPESIWVHAAPMFHLANGSAMYGLTMLGAGHCFIPYFDPELFLKAVEKHRATCSILVPTMINMLMNHPAVDKYDTSSLQLMAYGASPMPLDLLRRAIQKFGPIFQQGYGLTEAAPLLTWLHRDDHKFEGLDQKFAPLKSAGRAVLGVEVKVVDADDRELPPYEIGEVIARGDNIMKGYWKRPEVNREVLRNGWLHTGDLGAFDERGYLYILDRAKDMIKTGGENVYCPEVEQVLYQHADVLEAVIIGVPDERWGETIKAVVVTKPGRQISEPELIAFCRERLTHYKCPTSVHFIDALPKGGTGKIQKNKLREKLWATREKAVG